MNALWHLLIVAGKVFLSALLVGGIGLVAYIMCLGVLALLDQIGGWYHREYPGLRPVESDPIEVAADFAASPSAPLPPMPRNADVADAIKRSQRDYALYRKTGQLPGAGQ